MVQVHPTPHHHDDFVSKDFRIALSTALLDSLNYHLIAVVLSLFPSVLFILRIILPLLPISSTTFSYSHAYISYILSSTLIRVLLSLCALVYFPLLALWTSIVLAIFTFLLHQTPTVERLLNNLCVAVINPIVDYLLNNQNNLSSLSLTDLRHQLRHSASIVRKRESTVAKSGRRSPLKALVRVLTDIGIAAAIAALTYVAETRFKDALAIASAANYNNNTDDLANTGSSISSPSAVATALAADVVSEVVNAMGVGDELIPNNMNSNRSKRLSRTVVIAILRTEMVSAVLLPFKASVKTYLYGTLIVAVILLCGPLWMLW